jgi:hypothetical protein
MRYCVLLLAAASLAAQQSTTYVWDVDGNRHVFSQSRQAQTAGGKERVDSIPGLNGDSLATEQVSERLLSDTGGSRVVERTITYPNGERARVRIEETRSSGGASSVSTTLYRSDTNGEFQLAERSRSESGSGRSETTIERPTINGTFEVVERQASTERKLGAATEQTVVTYRPDTNGAFNEAVREISTRTARNGTTEETTDQYLAGEANSRTVTVTRKNADGSEVRDISIYGRNAPGRPAEDGLSLREQQRIEKRRTAPDTTVETLSVRRAPVDDTALGKFERISERVCTGCKP